MTAITFDTYKVINLLTDKGFTKDQSEAVVRVFQEVKVEDVVSKEEFLSVRDEVRTMRAELSQKITEFRLEAFKWFIPLFLGLYGLIVFKLGG